MAQTAEEVLQRLQEELDALQLHGGQGLDGRAAPQKGAGPRLFCGHVPKEATEELAKAHFSRWGVVTDVYFPRHKKTLKRRPFCFVTFAARESAERALAESPLNICGIPIKNLTMVEDRDQYYKEKHAAAQQALLGALRSMGAGGAVPPEQVNNIAAMLALEGVGAEAILASLLQGQPLQAQAAPPPHHQQLQQPLHALQQQLMLGHGQSGPRHSTGSVPAASEYRGATPSFDGRWPELRHGTHHGGGLRGDGGVYAGQASASLPPHLTSAPAPGQLYARQLNRSSCNDSLLSLSSADLYGRVSSELSTSDGRSPLDLPASFYSFSGSSGAAGSGLLPAQLAAPPPPLPPPPPPPQHYQQYGGAAGYAPFAAIPGTRLSVDEALQVRQHLLMAEQAGGSGAGFGGKLAAPAPPFAYHQHAQAHQHAQQQQQQQQLLQRVRQDAASSVLSAMRSSFYSPAPSPAQPLPPAAAVGGSGGSAPLSPPLARMSSPVASSPGQGASPPLPAIFEGSSSGFSGLSAHLADPPMSLHTLGQGPGWSPARTPLPAPSSTSPLAGPSAPESSSACSDLLAAGQDASALQADPWVGGDGSLVCSPRATVAQSDGGPAAAGLAMASAARQGSAVSSETLPGWAASSTCQQGEQQERPPFT